MGDIIQIKTKFLYKSIEININPSLDWKFNISNYKDIVEEIWLWEFSCYSSLIQKDWSENSKSGDTLRWKCRTDPEKILVCKRRVWQDTKDGDAGDNGCWSLFTTSVSHLCQLS